MQQKLIVAVVGLALAVAGVGSPAPATAASSSGVHSERFSECYSYRGVRECVDGRFMTQRVRTPSGNRVTRFQLKGTATVTHGGHRSVQRFSWTARRLVKDSREHLLTQRFSVKVAGDTPNCSLTFTVRRVKGEWRAEQFHTTGTGCKRML